MDKASILVECGLSLDMTPEQAERLAAAAQPGEFPEGSTLISEEDRERDIFIVYEGLVSFKIKPPIIGAEPLNKGRKPADLEILFFRGIVGELSFIDGLPRSASVVAMDNVKALRFSQDKLKRLLDSDPVLGYLFMRNLCAILCRKVRHAGEELKNHLFL